MLSIVIDGEEYFDEDTEEFVHPEALTIELEHSLVSLSKWEEKYKVPFLSKDSKTTEQLFDYIHCMVLTPDVTIETVKRLSDENVKQIQEYIDDTRTATWFAAERPGPKSSEAITAELIYYWMITFNIPLECAQWHLNKLFTLIKIFGVKSQKPKKVSGAQAAIDRRRLNEQRRRELNSKG